MTTVTYIWFGFKGFFPHFYQVEIFCCLGQILHFFSYCLVIDRVKACQDSQAGLNLYQASPGHVMTGTAHR